MAKMSPLQVSMAHQAYKRELDALQEIRHNPILKRQLSELFLGLRKDTGLAKSEMALLLDTSPSNLTNVEDGRWVPKLPIVHKARLLRKGLNYIKSGALNGDEPDDTGS